MFNIILYLSKGEHVCGRGECSHICAALEDRFECRCPLGMKLDETGRVCVGECVNTNCIEESCLQCVKFFVMEFYRVH